MPDAGHLLPFLTLVGMLPFGRLECCNAFQGWAPATLVDAVAGLSFLTHFDAISRGVLDLRDLLYFLVMTGFWLVATAIVIDMKKAD